MQSLASRWIPFLIVPAFLLVSANEAYAQRIPLIFIWCAGASIFAPFVAVPLKLGILRLMHLQVGSTASVASLCGRMGALVSGRFHHVSKRPTSRHSTGLAGGAGPGSLGSQGKRGQCLVALSAAALYSYAHSGTFAADSGLRFIASVRRLYSKAIVVADRQAPA